MDKVNVYKDAAGEWRWERRAANNEKIANSGEGYKNIGHCIKMAKRINTDANIFVMGQPIVEVQN